MSLKRLGVIAAFVTVGLTWASTSSALNVGGIDFTPSTFELEATTLAETLITGNGQTLTGYGVITTVNGNANYCVSDPNCRLFFTFTNYTSQNFTGTSVGFTGGQVFVFYDPGTGGPNTGQTRNLLDFSSPANIAYIQSLTPYADFTGHVQNASGDTLTATGTLSGASVSFLGSGLLDVNLADAFGTAAVENFFNGNGVASAFGGPADKVISSSGNNLVPNPNDTCTNQPGQFCIQGTADIRGITAVPAPGSIALLGVGLFGLGFVGRRFKTR
jgi:hypothetical protein